MTKNFKNMNLVKHRRNNLFPSLFDDLFLNETFFNEDYQDVSFIPQNDIVETEDNFTVSLVLPGFNKENFKLEITDNTLVVSGERKFDDETKYNVRQSTFGKFKRSYSLPKEILTDEIDAKYENGILNVVLPKNKELIGSKLIEVN